MSTPIPAEAPRRRPPPPPTPGQILVVVGHPAGDSFTRALADAYGAGAESAGADVDTLVVADLAFDPVLRQGFRAAQALEPDLDDARLRLERAAHVAWAFPMWWVGPPAVLRGFVDRVFLPGWAFRFDDGKALQDKLLRGRSARVITTMDSPRWWYHLVYRRALHRAFVTGTLDFCGFGPVAETTFYSVGKSSDVQRARWLSRAEAAGKADGERCRRVLTPRKSPHPQSLLDGEELARG